MRRGELGSKMENKLLLFLLLPLDDLRGQLERPGVLLVALALRQRGDFGLEHGVEVFGRRRKRGGGRRGRRRRRKHCVMVFDCRVLCVSFPPLSRPCCVSFALQASTISQDAPLFEKTRCLEAQRNRDSGCRASRAAAAADAVVAVVAVDARAVAALLPMLLLGFAIEGHVQQRIQRQGQQVCPRRERGRESETKKTK